MAARFSREGLWGHGVAEMRDGRPRWTGLVRLVQHRLNAPFGWRRPTLCFVNSTSDLFHEALPDADILRVFNVMRAVRDPKRDHRGRVTWGAHQFQVLTKRPERMLAFVSLLIERNGVLQLDFHGDAPQIDHIWLGVSAENQAAWDARVPLLVELKRLLPQLTVFVSCEPLLGFISADMARHLSWIQWVIGGDESGPGRRDVDWQAFRSLAGQCSSEGVAYFQKQLHQGQRKLGFQEFPYDLQLREMPRVWHEWLDRYPPDLRRELRRGGGP
jgi:protein gp37